MTIKNAKSRINKEITKKIFLASLVKNKKLQKKDKEQKIDCHALRLAKTEKKK